VYIRGMLGRGTCRGYREYSGDPIALRVARAHRGGCRQCRLGGVALGGRCRSGAFLPGACQDDQDDQENQNPVRRPLGSWHPNKMLIYIT